MQEFLIPPALACSSAGAGGGRRRLTYLARYPILPNRANEIPWKLFAVLVDETAYIDAETAYCTVLSTFLRPPSSVSSGRSRCIILSTVRCSNERVLLQFLFVCGTLSASAFAHTSRSFIFSLFPATGEEELLNRENQETKREPPLPPHIVSRGGTSWASYRYPCVAFCIQGLQQ